MEYENIIVERKGQIAEITLNRPEKLNALSRGHMLDIEKATEEFRDDVETRVIIFKGAGKHFSAGADLSPPPWDPAVPSTLHMRQRFGLLGQRMIRALQGINQITIAAVHGAALGGAACIISALDFRIGTESCFVAYPEIDLGISLSWLGLPLCAHLVGPSRAKRFVILGNREQPDTLLSWGFLDEVVPDDKLMDAAWKMAKEYASKPPIAAQLIKKSVNAIISAHDQSIMHMDTDQIMLLNTGKDAAEGRAAFFEKRDAVFTGD